MKIVLAQCESDWEGLYIDGVCVAEDHSLRLGSILELIQKRGTAITEFTSKWVDSEWMDERSDLPENIMEVKWE